MLNRRPGIVSLLLLLAALSSPANVARPLESLQLVVSISWIRGDQARAERRPRNPRPRQSRHAAVFTPPIQSRARSTALPSWFFQRPPPPALQAS